MKPTWVQTDRRNVELTLTATGIELVSSVTRHRREAFSRILNSLGAVDRVTVSTAMTLFAEATEALEGMTQFSP